MTQGKPEVSVIIPAARPRLVPDIVKALQQQSEDFALEIIIVCNNDECLPALSAEGLQFLRVPRTTNAPARRNAGMAIAQSDVFLFLDDDCVPLPGLIAQHMQHQMHGRLIVGGAVTFPAVPYLQAADNTSAFHDLLPSTARGERVYLCTSNLSVHRSVVARAGLMNERLNRADDLEWTARMRACGYGLYFEPRAVVCHDPPRSTWRAVWDHWVRDAPDTIYVRLRYAALLRTPQAATRRWMFLWASPLVAFWATLRTFGGMDVFFRYGHTLPLVYVTKLAWCWSAYYHFPTMELRQYGTKSSNHRH